MTFAALETRAGRPRHTSHPGEDDGGWDEDELFALVTRAYPYRNLSRETTTRSWKCFPKGLPRGAGAMALTSIAIE